MTRANTLDRLERLPGWEIISQGLADISEGKVTVFGCAVWIAAPRLQRAGVLDGAIMARHLAEPELQMYRLLRTEGGNAFGRYQAILRRLIRFEHALDRDAYALRRSIT